MEKALAPSFVHSFDAAVLKSSFQDWHQPIAPIHDCLKVLPNDMDKAKKKSNMDLFKFVKTIH